MVENRAVIRTKFAPPRPPRHILHRARITARLGEAAAFPVTIVRAGTGYGKSTAAAGLQAEPIPIIWYHLAAEDADPLVFLNHLVHAFALQRPGFSQGPVAALETWQQQPGGESAVNVLSILVNELDRQLDTPHFLILDDAHRLNSSAESSALLDRFLDRAPHQLHTILLTRRALQLPSLLRWRVRGTLLEIDQGELAFTTEETARLFDEQYGRPLSEAELALLGERVEGWPIALPLIRQRLQQKQPVPLPDALGSVARSTGDLFAWLVQEVLAQQPEEVRSFLRETAVLRDMTPGRCDTLRAAEDSGRLLAHLQDSGLFVVDLGGGHSRYHHLFRELLLNQIPPAELRASHLRTGSLLYDEGLVDEAVFHLLAAEAFDQAGEILSDRGRQLVRTGRLDTLASWLALLPPEVLDTHPNLLTYLGDIARLQSRFDEALAWYKQAAERSRHLGDRQGLSKSLRGQARVYLDTVNPSQAEQLLQEALRLADGLEDRESRARLLSLMAENLVNRGRFKEAQAYQEQARQLRQEGPSEVELPVRLMLRTGRLAEARQILEEQIALEKREPVLRPRAHRETYLLLSLILSFQGEQAAAYQAALQGTERGEQLQSAYITAVGFMRQGHTHLLHKNRAGYEQARHCFQKAIHISETLMVPRLKVEAYWGLTQAFGFQGDINQARQMAQAGISLAGEAGDDWIVAGLALALGASFLLAGEPAAAGRWLDRAAGGFEETGDSYGQTVTLLWLCLLWQQQGDSARLERDLARWLALIRRHAYGFVAVRPVLLGPPDPRVIVPLLLFAREARVEPAVTRDLLAAAGIDPRLRHHPGYRLRVQMLGPFRLWRGGEEIPAGAWKRQKARQLCQLFLTERERLLEREQIVDRLWPELDPESGERDFKIAYNTLLKVLEPERDRKAASFFIIRDGSRYGLRPEADVDHDAAAFDHLVAAGDAAYPHEPEKVIAAYRLAVSRYQGEFLQEYPYEEWAIEERERLLTTFLRTAERLARLLAEREEWNGVIAACEQLLTRDDCWEEAYRLLMRAYASQGQRALALRTYQRCAERLTTELDISPAPATIALYAAIAEGERV